MIEFHVTFSDMVSAREVAHAAVDARLAACANLVPGIISLYWWEGHITQENETLAVFKTSEKKADTLEAFLVKRHPYGIPAVIRHSAVSANPDYADWIEAETATQ